MSLYNLIHGVNPMAGFLLPALGLTTNQVPRFRDCWWTGEYIALHTRTGGGNREYYDEPNDDNREGPWNSTLRAVEGFSHDEDDNCDSTYATFYYKPSPQLLEVLKGFAATDATPEQRWRSFFDRMQNGSDDPQVARVMEAMKPMIEQIRTALESPQDELTREDFFQAKS